MIDTPQLSIEKANTMLTVENLVSIWKTGMSTKNLVEGKTRITVEGIEVKIESLLGSGGTKAVYSVTLNCKKYAMAICQYNDAPGIISEKWSSCLCEPENTKLLQNQGFLVNEESRIVHVAINGYDFPALMMKRYQDHPFRIYDSKNRIQGIPFSAVKGVDDCISELQSVRKDIRKLIKAGIVLIGDSFTICSQNNILRLYLNDLGNLQYDEITCDEIDGVLVKYSNFARIAYLNAHSDIAIRNNSFFSTLRIGCTGEPLKTNFIDSVRGED